jgi:outer membrane usher protein
VVRDLLGRETVVVQPFFTSGQLLAPGLDDFTFSGGWLRRNLGIASDSYGPGFAGGTWRRGITPSFTLEGRAEATHAFRALGAGATYAMPWEMLGTLAVAGSDSRNRARGWHWLVGFERQTLRNSFALQALGSSVDFRVLGLEDGLAEVRRQYAGNWTYYSDRAGTFGLGIVHMQRYGERDLSTLSANYSIEIWRGATLNLIASRAIAGSEASSVNMSVVMPLENQKLATASVTTHGSGSTDAYVAMSQSPSLGGAPGWRVLGGYQDGARAEAGIYQQGTRGDLTAEVSTRRDRTTARVNAIGGFVVADGSAFVTRRIDQSYAVIQVEGYPNVGVGIGGGVSSRTNSKGIALVPNLWPYQVNSIRLEAKDLPVSAEIDSIETQIVPRWKSAVKVAFPVRSGRGALVRILFDDGEPAPAGATVELDREKVPFYVARRGEAFMTGLTDHNLVRLRWKDKSCLFEVKLPAKNDDEVPRVGPITCRGVPR